MNVAAFSAAMVAISHTLNEMAELNILEVETQLKNIQVTLCEKMIAVLKDDTKDKTKLTMSEEKLLMQDVKLSEQKTYHIVPQYITTIKAVRERTYLGLREAKEMVDKWLLAHKIYK